MLYFFSGNDFKKVQKCSHELVERLVGDKPDSSVLQISEENISEYNLPDLLREQGLFEKKLVVVVSRLLDVESFWGDFKFNIQEIKDSNNIFIFIENKIDKRKSDKIIKFSEESKVFSLGEKEKYNPFGLTNALGQKNKKQLWLLFQQALLNGLSPEEIHGLLFWQVKSILIAKVAQNPTESGLKPFVFQKAKTFAENFSETELKKHSKDLVRIYHEARKGVGDLSTGLEKFILKV